MLLRELRVEQLRQFREPYVLDELSPGLNLLTGPNEAGKSTLVRAIRAAFFERHRSTTMQDLQPWGDSGAAKRCGQNTGSGSCCSKSANSANWFAVKPLVCKLIPCRCTCKK